jgi:hypothetical protein
MNWTQMGRTGGMLTAFVIMLLVVGSFGGGSGSE